jgi:large subunit ribosomal protein L15
MNLSNLQPAEGSTHNQNKRLGRGEGSEKVVLPQEVTKEQNLVLVILKDFEGGQMPLQRRVPKFGFTNINRKIRRCKS